MRLTDEQLTEVNAGRTARGLPELTMKEANGILFDRSFAGDDPVSFLIDTRAKVMSTPSSAPLTPPRTRR